MKDRTIDRTINRTNLKSEECVTSENNNINDIIIILQ